MYSGAILEDEAPIRDYLESTLTEEFRKRNVTIHFNAYESGERFLTVYQEHYHYDVIFLDIEMPGLDGIEVCRRIRHQSPEALVVFISNHDYLVFQTFEVQPFRFIRKSQYQELLPTLVDDVVGRLAMQSHHTVTITEPGTGDVYAFHVEDIQYVEVQGKDCRIVTAVSETSIRCPLWQIAQKLERFPFIQPHRSYLVNHKCIFRIQKASLTLIDGTQIGISRGRVEEVRRQFLQYSLS